MYYRLRRTAVAALSFAALAPMQYASAADAPAAPSNLPVKAVKPAIDLPFFFVIDDRVTYSWEPRATDPGSYSIRPNGSISGTTAKSVYSFTHFDAWAYGTNFFSISMYKSDQNDPASPCVNAGVLPSGAPATCAGATDIYGLLRSTFGWNEIFNTKAFALGPLRNISFEVGAGSVVENTFVAPAVNDFVAGVQLAFDLPYKGYFNVAPMAYKSIAHIAFEQCGLFGPGVPGVTCLADGMVVNPVTWAVETNYYMDLGFLPESMRYFAVSGSFEWFGPKGDQNAPLVGTGTGRFSTATKTEFKSEPIRLTFDASKATFGPKYSHFVDVWVAYRYWQNKYGLDHDAAPSICTVKATGESTNSCTESSIYAGVTVKF
jgi:hypothetical protein